MKPKSAQESTPVEPQPNPGPLQGLRVVELAGLGPAPHAAMLLADLGADVIRVERLTSNQLPEPCMRGKRVTHMDLKCPAGITKVLELVRGADILVEGFRPGVAERLGLGPDVCLSHNPRLVYGRMTGWGQDGPLAQRAGHDINYISLTGALHAMGRKGEPPAPPLNLVGDYGGGSMFLVTGLLAALFYRTRTGQGQVIDAAMLDGATMLSHMFWGFRGLGLWSDSRADNLLDGGAPFYDTYACSDGRYVAVGALEPQFYQALLSGLGLNSHDLPDQHDKARWPELRAHFQRCFGSQTRDHWSRLFAETDACVTPVLTFAEAAEHPHIKARGTLIELGGTVQGATAPRFSQSRANVPRPATTHLSSEIDWLSS